jgi:hypothetical protein
MSLEVLIVPEPDPEEQTAIAEAVRGVVEPEPVSRWRAAALREGVADDEDDDR